MRLHCYKLDRVIQMPDPKTYPYSYSPCRRVFHRTNFQPGSWRANKKESLHARNLNLVTFCRKLGHALFVLLLRTPTTLSIAYRSPRAHRGPDSRRCRSYRRCTISSDLTLCVTNDDCFREVVYGLSAQSNSTPETNVESCARFSKTMRSCGP